MHISDCPKSACNLSRKKISLRTPSDVHIPGGPTDIAEDAELQPEWIPRQVKCCGAAEYVSVQNWEAGPLFIMREKLDYDFDSADKTPMTQQCRSWI